MYNYPIKKNQVHAHEECSHSKMNSFWQIHQQLMIKRFHPECVSALKTRRIRYTTRKAGQNMFAIQVHNVHIHLCISMGTSIHASASIHASVQYTCMCKRAYMCQYPAIGFSIAIDLRLLKSLFISFNSRVLLQRILTG